MYIRCKLFCKYVVQPKVTMSCTRDVFNIKHCIIILFFQLPIECVNILLLYYLYYFNTSYMGIKDDTISGKH